MRTWVLLACFSFGVAACDDGDDLERKTDAGTVDSRPADTAPATDTAPGTDVRDGATDVRDGGTDTPASTDGSADRTDTGSTDRPPDTTTTDATAEAGEGGTSVDAADTAGQ